MRNKIANIFGFSGLLLSHLSLIVVVFNLGAIIIAGFTKLGLNKIQNDNTINLQTWQNSNDFMTTILDSSPWIAVASIIGSVLGVLFLYLSDGIGKADNPPWV